MCALHYEMAPSDSWSFASEECDFIEYDGKHPSHYVHRGRGEVYLATTEGGEDFVDKVGTWTERRGTRWLQAGAPLIQAALERCVAARRGAEKDRKRAPSPARTGASGPAASKPRHPALLQVAAMDAATRGTNGSDSSRGEHRTSVGISTPKHGTSNNFTVSYYDSDDVEYRKVRIGGRTFLVDEGDGENGLVFAIAEEQRRADGTVVDVLDQVGDWSKTRGVQLWNAASGKMKALAAFKALGVDTKKADRPTASSRAGRAGAADAAGRPSGAGGACDPPAGGAGRLPARKARHETETERRARKRRERERQREEARRAEESAAAAASEHGASEHGASKHGASKHGASKHGASKHGASRPDDEEWILDVAILRYPLRSGRSREFRLLAKIGSGTFGDVLLAERLDATGRPTGKRVAIKREAVTNKARLLEREWEIYGLLEEEGVRGLPVGEWWGEDEHGENRLMVMTLLGPSLKWVSKQCGGRFSIQTVCLIMRQAVSVLRAVHGLGYLHRDIKPANFCVGLGPRSQEIFLVDFGFVKSYLTVADDDGPSSEGKDSGGGDGGRRDASRRVHMAEKTGCRMRGTARYASLRNHMGVEQTRRDDMETLGYVALYMLRGSLPWQSCVIPPKKPKHLQKRQGNERFDEIMRMKRDTSHEDLCMEWPGGTQFVTYMKYCRSLAYAEEPDYAMLIDLFEGILEKTLGLDPHDCGFDWPFSRFRYGGIVPPARGKARWPKATFKACEGPRQEAYASKCLAQAEEAAAAWHRQERKAGRKT